MSRFHGWHGQSVPYRADVDTRTASPAVVVDLRSMDEIYRAIDEMDRALRAFVSAHARDDDTDCLCDLCVHARRLIAARVRARLERAR